MEFTTLRYMDSNSIVHSQIFYILVVKGIDRLWKWKYVPDIIFKLADQSQRTEYRGFQRIIGVELAPISTGDEFILAFFQASTKSLTYQGQRLVSEEGQVVFEQTDYENEWVENFSLSKKYTFELKESTILHDWPEPIPIVYEDTMYIKLKVKIEGTQSSPETFTTNSGKFAVDETGSVFPAISLLSNVVSIISDGAKYQDKAINQIGDIVQAGSNISFQLAASDAGNNSGDGYIYSDIIICIQARP